MTRFHTTIDINAPADQVWPIVADAIAFPDWDSGVLAVEGEVRPGATIRLRSEVAPKRTFKLKVSEMRAPSIMKLSSGMPFGLFKGERTYAVKPTGDRSCSFSMTEAYSGPLAGMITKSIPDLQPSFEKFARGLKAEAEGS